MDFIEALENAIGRKIEKNFLPMQAGDVLSTYADVSDIRDELGYQPQTSLEEGIERFVSWYREFFRIA